MCSRLTHVNDYGGWDRLATEDNWGTIHQLSPYRAWGMVKWSANPASYQRLSKKQQARVSNELLQSLRPEHCYYSSLPMQEKQHRPLQDNQNDVSVNFLRKKMNCNYVADDSISRLSFKCSDEKYTGNYLSDEQCCQAILPPRPWNQFN
jgi:hypothetical protein